MHIFCRNDVDVEGSTHRQVVDLIKSGGDRLTLKVVSVPPQEIDRLDPPTNSADESPGPTYTYYDYSEKRSLPITVPDYQWLMKDGEKYVVIEKLTQNFFFFS